MNPYSYASFSVFPERSYYWLIPVQHRRIPHCDSDPGSDVEGSQDSAFSFAHRLNDQALGEDLPEMNDSSILHHGEVQLGMHYRKIHVPPLERQGSAKTKLTGLDEEDRRFLKNLTNGGKLVPQHLSRTERPHANFGTSFLFGLSKDETPLLVHSVEGECHIERENSFSIQGRSDHVSSEICNPANLVNLRAMGAVSLVMKDGEGATTLLPSTNDSFQHLDASRGNLLQIQKAGTEIPNPEVHQDPVPARSLGDKIKACCSGCRNACARIFR